MLLLIVAVGIDVAHLNSSLSRTRTKLRGSGGGGTTYLILGSDSRDNARSVDGMKEFGTTADIATSGSDILMVLRVPDDGPARLVSIPRDLIVNLPGEGPNRITLSFARGLPFTIDTFCSALGIGVDHALVIGFAGFIDLVDAVGGIDINIPMPLRDQQSGLDLETAGPNHLDGLAALAYVRSRHPEIRIGGAWIAIPDASNTRLTHSKEVIGQLAAKTLAARSNPWRAQQIASAAVAATTVDDQMGITDLRKALDGLTATKSGINGATTADLPVLEHPDELTTSELNDKSVPVLDQLGSGRNPACPKPIPRRFTDPTAPPPIGPSQAFDPSATTPPPPTTTPPPPPPPTTPTAPGPGRTTVSSDSGAVS